MELKDMEAKGQRTSNTTPCQRDGFMMSGQDLVVAGFAGHAGTVEIVRQRREELLLRFRETYLEKITKARGRAWNGILKGWESTGVTAWEPVGEGGILAALWNLSGANGVGIEFSLSLIPVRQSTIEICEWYDLNPYRLYSVGCFLYAAHNGGRLVCMLEEEGSFGAVIGRVTRGRSRIIKHGESRGYLERPAEDEIHKLSRR